MREIKFRQFIDGKFKYSGMADKRFHNSFTAPHCYFESYPLEQFTGLQDKNGIDIYEGDIFLNGESPRVIEFSDGNFHAVNAERTCSILLSFIVNNPRNEVIGTIHTTPELLK